ncbi:hypothetical protein [uncultured Methanobacterium sp.]|uniref:hypothetical protein n=1 Tax=uncultured Methanobacterium sp. TaxID=176306 RepID=UPI002AA6C32B|nr:hypothetical protein [uncultured Methanobacterium sp.]
MKITSRTKIEDRELLKETAINLVEKQYMGLIAFLIALIGITVAITQGIGLHQIIDYVYAILIGIIIFLLSLTCAIFVIYKKTLNKKIKDRENFKKLMDACDELNEYIREW